MASGYVMKTCFFAGKRDLSKSSFWNLLRLRICELLDKIYPKYLIWKVFCTQYDGRPSKVTTTISTPTKGDSIVNSKRKVLSVLHSHC